MPVGVQEELNGSVTANCYAYACKCDNPNVGNPPRQAKPGVHGGAATVNNGDVGQLTAGITADGGVGLAGDPLNIPNPPAHHYLIAMLTNAHGFHFLCRDEFTKRWSWKDANLGTIKFNVLHLPSDHYRYVNDTILNDILVANRNDYMWAYNSMTFQRFFAIPNIGITVAG